MRLLKFIIFYPFSILFGVITFVRNKLYDAKILTSKQFDVPIISVGNLAMGGTGKTPHVEYIIRLFKNDFKLSTISRGYGRATKGFLIADKFSNHHKIGDEPLQYFQKFKDIIVCVDENRKRGISKLLEQNKNLSAIVMDDAFQHRSVKSGLSILLTDFYKLYSEDHIFPFGNLREYKCGSERADMIVVTKCPKVISSYEIRAISQKLISRKEQKVFFSYVDYCLHWKTLTDNKKVKPIKANTIILFAGIANVYPLQEYLSQYCSDLISIKFKDHHNYSIKDIKKIKQTHKNCPYQSKIIVTTEKDAMRILNTEIIHTFDGLSVYYIPIKVKFHKEFEADFNKEIEDYVRKNKRKR